MAHTHRMQDQFRSADAGSFSDDQFEELVNLLKPMHDLAVLILSQHEAAAETSDTKSKKD